MVPLSKIWEWEAACRSTPTDDLAVYRRPANGVGHPSPNTFKRICILDVLTLVPVLSSVGRSN